MKNAHNPEESDHKAVYTGCCANADGQRARDRTDKSRFPKEVMPELSQLGKPRRAGNTHHRDRFKSTYTELGVCWGPGG